MNKNFSWLKVKVFCVIFAGAVIVAGVTGCKKDVRLPPYGHMIVKTSEPLKELGYWKTESSADGELSVDISVNDSKAAVQTYTVTVNLTNDVDSLAWTKENGEFIPLPIPRGQKFDATFKYKKGPHTFTFAEAGVYILNIHPTKTSSVNTEDLSYRGKVRVGAEPVTISDKDIKNSSAGTTPRLAVYTVTNDSYCFGSGNNMTEFAYVDPTDKRNIYNASFKYSGFNLQTGKSVNLLFPEQKGGYILKPVVEGQRTVFHGQTTKRTPGSYSMQGLLPGNYNGDFAPIGNGQFKAY